MPGSEAFDRIVDIMAASGHYASLMNLIADHPEVREIYADVLERHERLSRALEGLLLAHAALVDAFSTRKKLLLCGNGGSHADALHIAGELMKSFNRPRPLPEEWAGRLAALPLGTELAAKLEQGLPAIVLGGNAALATAVANDTGDGRMVFAQECLALGMPGDVLLALSTSGESANVRAAVSVARLRDMTVVAFTGEGGGALAKEADVVIPAPGSTARAVQENHIVLYHALCAALEAHFFIRLRHAPEGMDRVE